MNRATRRATRSATGDQLTRDGGSRAPCSSRPTVGAPKVRTDAGPRCPPTRRGAANQRLAPLRARERSATGSLFGNAEASLKKKKFFLEYLFKKKKKEKTVRDSSGLMSGRAEIFIAVHQ